jgi:hypothetical protein
MTRFKATSPSRVNSSVAYGLIKLYLAVFLGVCHCLFILIQPLISVGDFIRTQS